MIRLFFIEYILNYIIKTAMKVDNEIDDMYALTLLVKSHHEYSLLCTEQLKKIKGNK